MTTSKVISNTQTSNSYSSIAMLSMLAAGTLIGGLTLVSVPSVEVGQSKVLSKYYSTMNASSYDSYTNVSKDEYLLKVSVEELIGTLYSKMLVSQESLGREFKDIYFKNAWNLYDN